jgi:hypothetical protein
MVSNHTSKLARQLMPLSRSRAASSRPENPHGAARPEILARSGVAHGTHLAGGKCAPAFGQAGERALADEIPLEFRDAARTRIIGLPAGLRWSVSIPWPRTITRTPARSSAWIFATS